MPSNFSLFELGVAAEVFGLSRSDLGVEWYDFVICTDRPGVTPAHGRLFCASIAAGLEVLEDADTVVIPEADASTWPATPEVIEAVRAAYDRGARMVSYCTGSFVLAAAGVLDGRPAATHWLYAEKMARDHPWVEVNAGVLYVDDGQVLTSAGTAAGVDLSLHIVRKDHGERVARMVARRMVVPPHREGGQAQFVEMPLAATDSSSAAIGRAMEYATRNIDSDLALADLAAAAFMSTRNFSRRFREATGTTPVRWVLAQRLARVRELLEETDESVERIAELAGFRSAVTLRQRFVAHMHTSPSAYRKTFRSSASIVTREPAREQAAANGVVPEPLPGNAAVRGTSQGLRSA